MIDKTTKLDQDNLNNLNSTIRRRRSRRLASTRGIKWHNSELDVYYQNQTNYTGWIRLFAGPAGFKDTENVSSLLEIDLNTTVYDLLQLLCLPSELTIYKQIGGNEGVRLHENATLLEEQDAFLRGLGIGDETRRKRLGLDPELCFLLSFHLGPSIPLKSFRGLKTCGSVFVLKGLVFPQWKLRPMCIFGGVLFIYPGDVEGTPEEIELSNHQITITENRGGRFVLQISPFYSSPSTSSSSNSSTSSIHKTDVIHYPLRQVYLGFDRLWERDLWHSWLLKVGSL